MSYTRDKTAQLADAVAKGYGARAAQLRREGTPTKQHNVNVTTTAAKKTAAKKTAAKKVSAKPAKKTAAKKTATKKSAAKKSAAAKNS